jgi:transposase
MRSSYLGVSKASRIRDLEQQLRERDALIAKLQARNEELEARVRELEEKLGTNSRNSSKPPSSDPPSKPPKTRKPPSGRKPGGQPGHEGHQRALVPLDRVDRLTKVKPERCERCDGALEGEDPDPIRHQVFHLPKIEPIVEEHQLHALTCERPGCGHVTRAKLPDGVPTRSFGPSVDATVGVLMGKYRLSKRDVPEVMHDLCSLEMSVGAVIGCQEAVSEALEPPVVEARAYVAEQPVKNADETSWREGAGRARVWLWAAITPLVAVFMVHARRNSDAARTLLGKVRGVLITDRHGAYNWWPDVLRQFCWAHLKRDLVKISERGGDSARIGKALLEEEAQMFAWWYRIRDGTLKRSTFKVYMRPVQNRFHALLVEGAALDHPKTSKACKLLLKHFDALWTFVYHEGVEPTNNDAEQTVRHGVILRKISYGTHSEAGSRFIERILTVHATLLRQDRNVLEFVQAACEARLHGRKPPSLLPDTDNGSMTAIAA